MRNKVKRIKAEIKELNDDFNTYRINHTDYESTLSSIITTGG